MIRAKVLADRQVVVIDEGISYLFDLGGRCIKEDAGLIPKYTDGVQEFDILSILSSRGEVEVAFFKEGQPIRRFKGTEEAMTYALMVNYNGGFVRLLRRDGVSEGIRFNQLIVLYPVGTDLTTKVPMEKLKEV